MRCSSTTSGTTSGTALTAFTNGLVLTFRERLGEGVLVTGDGGAGGEVGDGFDTPVL